PTRITAQLDLQDGWCCLNAFIAPQDGSKNLWDYLVGHELPGKTRFVLDPVDQAIHLRSDIPVDVQDVLADRIHQTLDEFRDVLTASSARRIPSEQTGLQPSSASRRLNAIPDLSSLCSEAGWQFTA